MKKFFAFVAAALVAFSFTSCDKNEPSPEKKVSFQIEVSDITTNSANVVITPSDTAVYFGVGIYEASAVEKYTEEALAEHGIEEAAYYYAYGVPLETLAEYNYVFKGAFASPLTSLPQNKELAILVYEIVENENGLEVGVINTKIFKTEEAEASEATYELTGVMKDWRAKDGDLYIKAAPADSSIVFYVDIYTSEYNGTFHLGDETSAVPYLDNYYTYIAIGKDFVDLEDAELVGTINEAGDAYTVAGDLVGNNACTYHVTITCPVELAEGAPVRKAAAKFDAENIKPATLRYKKFARR